MATNLQPLTDSIGYAESAKESAEAAASSASAASTSETNAAASEKAASESQSAAKTSETNAKASETAAAKSQTAAATSASGAAVSASASASSASAAKASETNAKASETNAAASATAAAASARTQQADWSETNSSLQSFIKGKPNNLVTTDAVQTISGDKTFSGAVTMATANADTLNATALNVTGSTSVPTANADNNSNAIANTSFVKTAIANLVGSAPTTLDTLQELSAALGNDANFSATVAKKIGEKLDKAGGTITGPILYDKTPNDDTELPNKAYVDAAINSAVASVTKTLSDNMHAQYPVGSYIYSDKANNPATYLPYMSDTTWVQTAAGRVLIGAGKADSGTTYTAGATGGEEKHKLSVEELPPSMGRITGVVLWNGGQTSGIITNETYHYNLALNMGGNNLGGNSITLSGGGKAQNNMPPYTTIYVFHRTA